MVLDTLFYRQVSQKYFECYVNEEEEGCLNGSLVRAIRSFFALAIALWAFGILLESPVARWVSSPFNWYEAFLRFLARLVALRITHPYYCDYIMRGLASINLRAVMELTVLSIEDIPQIVFSTIVDRQNGGDITGYALANIVTSIYSLVARGAAGAGSIAQSGAMVDQLPAGLLVARLEGNTDREVLNTIDEARRARAAASKCDKEARKKERNLQRGGQGAEEQDDLLVQMNQIV